MEKYRLVFVVHKVLDVTHFMVSDTKKLASHICALLDPCLVYLKNPMISHNQNKSIMLANPSAVRI